MIPKVFKRFGKTVLSVLLVSILCFSSIFVAMAEELIAEEKPVLNGDVYEIATAEQLLYLSQNYGTDDCPKTATYMLTADIDMSNITNFKPIGRFYGVFDGNYHIINNLTIDKGDSGTVGFFNHLGDSDVQAVVKNLGLTNIYVRGTNTVGGICGMLWGTVENCFVTGEVVGNNHGIGGIAGRTPAFSSGSVNKQPTEEEAAKATIRNCYTVVTVREEGSADSQGGLVGRSLNPYTTIENSYAAGVVEGYNRVGGLVGDLREGGVVRGCVAANPMVTGTQSVSSAIGRILVDPEQTATNILSWDKMKKTGPGGTLDGKTVNMDELQTIDTFKDLGWDFENTWDFLTFTDNGKTYGCPVLKGFEKQDYTYDFETYLSTISFSLVSTEQTANSLTLKIENVADSEDENYSASQYCIIQSKKKPLSEQIVWQDSDEKTFTDLSPSSPYSFWGRVKNADGKESSWVSLQVYTKYKISTDKNPMNIAVAMTEEPSTSATVSWATPDITLTHPVVQLIKKSASETLPADGQLSFEGTTDVREISMTTNEKLLDGIRGFYTVSLTGLEPDTEYVYRVGDAEQGYWSTLGSFSTAPVENKAITFIYMSDSQVSNSSDAFRTTFNTAQRLYPNATFTYFGGDMTENGFAHGQWDLLFEGGQDAFRKTVVSATTGNHDRNKDMSLYFNQPETIYPDVYSFDYGNAHFMVLNTEYYSDEELDKQIEWLRSEVEASNKGFNIVMLHKALYSATDHVDDADVDAIRAKLVPVFQELNIDVVIQGHDHSFSRGFIKDGNNANAEKFDDQGTEVFTKPSAPLYFINGICGSSKWYKKIQYDASLYHYVTPDYEFIDKTSATYETTMEDQSYTAITIDGDNMTLDTYYMHYDKENPNGYIQEPYLFDSIVISKGNYVTKEQRAVIKAFVERLYSLVLNRVPGEEEQQGWINALANKESSGVDAGFGFVFSPEGIDRNFSNEEFVEILYNTFMGRPSDEGGKAAWVSQLDAGVDREKVFEGFVYSPEFAEICDNYGIEVGDVNNVDALKEVLNLYRNQNADITKFVARCYKEILDRIPDAEGLEAWCKVIITEENTPRDVAAEGFLFSDEFRSKKITDTEYVQILYRAFLDREADETGLSDWTGVLAGGEETRDDIIDGFANSDEFKEVLKEFGLAE